MTGVTHIAFALACGSVVGVSSPIDLQLLACGSLLPDIDHPQSFAGRLFFFLSIPLHRIFGHRQSIHGFALWTAVAGVGFFWKPALLLGLGALSHIVIDCFSTSGVQALRPFSETVCVLFARKHRLNVGSRKELFLLVILSVVAWGAGYVGAMGGMRGVLGVLIGSPRIAFQQYVEAGTQISVMTGTLRHQDGRIEKGEWLMVGKEGEGGKFAIWDEGRKRLIHTPRDAKFLRAFLQTDESLHWKTLALTGWARTKREAFFFDGEFWRHAAEGSIVFGWVMGKELEMVTIESEYSKEK